MATNDACVQVREEEIVIPTYEAGEPDPNPLFLERRVFQGSSGNVYPFPVIEAVSDTPVEKRYRAVFLENQYVKVMVLPELGGRIQMAQDKTNGYHFVYFNRVIKPALVGLTGPWVSGGIEFNWPQHHRPSTFLPVDYSIEQREDGSATVWLGEIERQHHTQGLAGITLYPGKSCIEVQGRVINRTPLPHPFLWWANPAVHANETYQSIFPPDVTAVMDHGKRDVSSFPIAHGTYYKVDYSEGVDISFYRNIPVPTSYMAYQSSYDFVGGYDHGRKAGMLHVADHHVSPGKKQWTWGTGEFAKAWERHLTDGDGPYIELMTGVFTDNQPDFTWLAPYEQKSFTQYFLPFKDIGYVRQASPELVLACDMIEATDGPAIRLGLYATSVGRRRIIVSAPSAELYDHLVEVGPDQPFITVVSGLSGIQEDKLLVRVQDENGNAMLSYSPGREEPKALPDPARDPGTPGDIGSVDELYLLGLHLEQYRHATRRPDDYYLEGLRRDPGDARCNNAYGRLLLTQGQFSESERYFRLAIERITWLNPNPSDGEPYFNLGLSLLFQERFDEAYDAFYKSVWSGPWQSAGYLEVARIDCRRADYAAALEHVNSSLAASSFNGVARHLRVVILRHLGRVSEALEQARDNLSINSHDYGSRHEISLLSGDTGPQLSAAQFASSPQPSIDLAIDYASAGFFEEACEVLDAAISRQAEADIYPMLLYYRGYYSGVGSADGARRTVPSFEQAERLRVDHCFPDRLQSVAVLKAAIASLDPDGGTKAQYYLGNLWYSKRQYSRAVECWRGAAQHPDVPAVVYRNLAIASFNKDSDESAAIRHMNRAVELDPHSARFRLELDLLHKRIGTSVAERLGELERIRDMCNQRDDLCLELAHLRNCAGEYEAALDLLSLHVFHPWEGGEGKVAAEYRVAARELARSALARGDAPGSIDWLERALALPQNLGEGRLEGASDNDIHYLLGLSYEMKGETALARREFELAAAGDTELGLELFYNDKPADTKFSVGLALRALGDERAAVRQFEELVSHGIKHKDDVIEIDFFAVSFPDFAVFEEDLNRRNHANCCYLAGLGKLGLGDIPSAKAWLEQAVETVPDMLQAIVHLRSVEQ